MNEHMKMEVELLRHGVVEGTLWLFGADWMENYSDAEMESGALPANELSRASHEIVDGEWHHFGSLVFAFAHGKLARGFFNGSYFIGEWHPTGREQFLTAKSKLGGVLHRATNTTSVDSEHDEGQQEQEQEEDAAAAMERRHGYEERAKHRIGHFEFSCISEQDDNSKRLMQTARGGMISVSMAQNEEKEEDMDVDVDEQDATGANGGVLHRNVSLDSDDDDDDVQDIE